LSHVSCRLKRHAAREPCGSGNSAGKATYPSLIPQQVFFTNV
jgi:hypothetical protein